MDLSGSNSGKLHYWTEFDEHGERLVLPLSRSWKVVIGALFGFAFAIFKMHSAFDHEPGLFEYALFAALIGGAVYLTLNILTSLLAREVIQISGGVLIHGWRLFGLKREKRYQLSEVSGLGINTEESAASLDKLVSPFSDFGKAGIVSFYHRGTRVGLGAAINDSHGQRVIEWIARRAPRNVTET